MKLGREGEGAGVLRVGESGSIIFGMKGAVCILDMPRNTNKGGCF